MILFSTAVEGDTLYVDQDFSLQFGLLYGEGADYLRYEQGPLPSLNPSIALSTSLLASVLLQEDFTVQVEARNVDEFTGYLGLSWKAWGVRLGSQRLGILREGLALNRELEGLRLFYQEEDKGLDVFASQSRSRYTEVTLSGDDTMGPFFLGHRNIMENSEKVYVNGQEQRRGQGPMDEDYYVDYQGGFLFFNRIILSHQEIRISYEYEMDAGHLSSTFMGVIADYSLGDVQGGLFLLWDEMPLEQDSILKETGYSRMGWGLTLDHTPWEGLDISQTVLGIDYSGYQSRISQRTDSFVYGEEVFTYTLRRRPVLYESETVLMAGGELVRNLDYSMDYHAGEITFFYPLEPGEAFSIHYRFIEEGDPDLFEVLQGYRSMSRLNYQGDSIHHHSYLSLVQDEYVSFVTQRPPPEEIRYNTRNQIFLHENWILGGDLTFQEQQDRKSYLPSLSLAFDDEGIYSRLRLSSRMVEEEGELISQNSLSGRLKVETFSTMDLSFKKDLDAPEDLFQEYSLSFTGTMGSLPYLFRYSHGEEHYQERINTQLTLPFHWTGTRGSLILRNTLLYKEGFSVSPRVVSSLSGRVNVVTPQRIYLNTSTVVSHVKGHLSQTDTYDFTGEVGRDISQNFMLNYNLNLKGNTSIFDGEKTQERTSTTHTVTLVGQLVEDLNLTLSLGEQQGSTWRQDRDPVQLLEHRLDSALYYSWQAFRSSLALNIAWGTTTTGNEVTATDSQRIQAEVDYRPAEALSFRGGISYSLFQGEKDRYQLTLRPYQNISQDLQLFAQYSYTRMVDRGSWEDLYESHILKMGFSFQM